jgi:biotin carboxyl carrier protein
VVAELASATAGEVDITVDGIRRVVRVHRVGAITYVDDHAGSSTLVEAERFPLPDDYVDPGSLLAPMPGAVVRILGAVGDVVDAGDTIIVVEAMKMEHRIDCPTSGTIAAILVEVGDQVDAGTLLASVDDATDRTADLPAPPES